MYGPRGRAETARKTCCWLLLFLLLTPKAYVPARLYQVPGGIFSILFAFFCNKICWRAARKKNNQPGKNSRCTAGFSLSIPGILQLRQGGGALPYEVMKRLVRDSINSTINRIAYILVRVHILGTRAHTLLLLLWV